MSLFTERVKAELEDARMKHPPITSLHEGYAIVLEELDEVKEEVWKRPSKRDPVHVLKELVQLGAMVQRMAEDVLLKDRV